MVLPFNGLAGFDRSSLLPRYQQLKRHGATALLLSFRTVVPAGHVCARGFFLCPHRIGLVLASKDGWVRAVVSFLILLAGLLLFPAGSYAQEIPVVVIKPRAKSVFVEESKAVSVSVVTRDEAEEKGLDTVQDVLEEVPGVILSRSDSPGGVSSLFLRGMESSQTLVLLDGMPINDPSGTTGAFNFAQDLMGEIEQVEVLRGPASVRYGSSAIGGVVNLVSREPETGALSPSGSAYAGSDGTAGGQGLVSGSLGKTSYLASVEGRHADGFNTLPERFPNNPRDPKGSDTTTLFGKLGYTLDQQTRLKALVRWRKSEFELNDQTISTPAYVGAASIANWLARGERDWLGKRAQSSVSVGQTLVERSYRNDPDASALAAGSSWLRAKYGGARTMMNVANDFRLPNTPFFDQGLVGTGVGYASESADIDYRSNGIYGPFDQAADASHSNIGVYGTAQGRVFKCVNLSVGVREEYPQAYASHTTISLGGALELPEVSARVKSSFGTAFRTPSLFERYGVDNYGLVGNSALRPEKSKSWEAGFERDVAVGDRDRFASVSAVYFETSTRDLIQYELSPTPQYRNVARAEISGVESRINIFPTSWMSAQASWTWVRSVNASAEAFSGTPSDKQLLRRPKHTASGSMTIWATPRWSVVPKLRYVGAHHDQLYADTGAYSGRGRVGAQVLADLASEYRVSERTHVYVRVRNLLNRSVESPNGYLLEPLTVVVGLRYE
jgi:vitamin B12 transporter